MSDSGAAGAPAKLEAEVKKVEITIGELTHEVDERVAAYISALEKDFELMKAHAVELEGKAEKAVKELNDFREEVAQKWDAEVEKIKAGAVTVKKVAGKDIRAAILAFKEGLQSSSQSVHDMFDRLLAHLKV